MGAHEMEAQVVIARRNDEAIPTTKRHCEEERRSNPQVLLNYSLVIIRGLLHPAIGTLLIQTLYGRNSK